jgi:transposase
LFPHSTSNIGRLYGVNGKLLARQYRSHLSDFQSWPQRTHAKKWLLYPENLGPQLSIDETSLSRGELYTILTNKAVKGGRGSIVAIVAGTKAETVTLDMASSMTMIAKRCFPRAVRVTDRFHVQRLAVEALQEIRIKHRWDALDQENDAIEQAKASQTEYQPEILANGDTVKQLLARSRYALYKKPTTWTESQKERAQLVFERFPDLKKHMIWLKSSVISSRPQRKKYMD